MFKLVIADPEFSSWSMRAWLVAKLAELDFTEEIIEMKQANTAENIAKYSPTGKVPVLIHDELLIADSLAISFYIANSYPKALIFPRERVKAAKALSLICEIHSSFAHLRKECPMNLLATPAAKNNISQDLQNDIDRVIQITQEFQGPYALGDYSIADCFMAPLMTRLHTYGIPIPEATQVYSNTLMAHPNIKQWFEKAKQWRL